MFVKQMLCENTWMDCKPETCPLNIDGKKCLMPTKQFQYDTMITASIYAHDVPILQTEVCGEKPNPERDEKKLCITSCWNLCYASLAYGMEVGKDWASLIKMEKNRETGIINTNKYLIHLNGVESKGKIYCDLLQLLKMMVSAMDEVGIQEVEMHNACQKLVKLSKLKPGSTRKL